MDITPTSGRFTVTSVEDGEVIKTFSAIKEWLSSDPLTPKTPSFVKKEKKEVVNESVAVTTETPQATERLTGFEGESQRSRVSWNISEGFSDDGNQKDEKHYVAPEESNVSRTMAWLLKTSKPPSAVHQFAHGSAADHYKRDIDTETGDFIPEVCYPDTFKTLHDGPSRDHKDLAWRQANMTVELQITREIRSRELLATKLRSQLTPQVEEAPVEQTAWPNAECTVRPVMPEDFSAIATIINMESRAEGSSQTFEWKNVMATDVQRIYDSCRDGLRPFIVATTAEDPLLDRSNWPDNATRAYQSYLAFRSSQAKTPQEILGFAFVTEARVGILGTPCPGSRHAGQVKVIVHPDHRGKLYGSALLDRILLCTAPFHRHLVDYEWQCRDSAMVYEPISYQNRRKYAWIYVESFCTSKDDPAYKLASNYLAKFEFREVAYLPSAVKTDRNYNSQWLDLVLWARETQPRSNIVDLVPGAQSM
ncbi:acyl- n-acyltransferase [Trichoderma arundinaceum]|uniref:Acyl-n-acyltransferase n=1 Tax=Trichoderma arundinaceum TaxID=490622 RepID=A0A395NT90_TRIAR|nr:acyl- n-acyltransferase [Trichoderma arundinaceum]